MNNYKDVESKLNEYQVPFIFHEMSVVNLCFEKDTLIARFTLTKYLDDLDLLNDNELAILEVKYSNINIKEIYLYGGFDFRNCDVFSLTETDDGLISLVLENFDDDLYFRMEFIAKSYNWKVISVIKEEEYEAFSDKIHNKKLNGDLIDDDDFPDWAIIPSK